MNLDKTVQCLLGKHEWAFRYIHPNSCDAQIICNHCRKVKGSIKVVHHLQKAYVNEESCETRDVCSRCKVLVGPSIVMHQLKKVYINEKSCEILKICFRCKTILGEPATKHKWEWVTINPCVQQQICKRCGAKGGVNESEHRWKELYISPNSCETYATCERCGLNHDSKGYVIHDWDYQYLETNSCIKQQICKRCHALGFADDSGPNKWGVFCSDKQKRARYSDLQTAVRNLEFSGKLWYIAERTADWDIKREHQINQVVRNQASINRSILAHTNISMYAIVFSQIVISKTAIGEQCIIFYPNNITILQGNSPEHNGREIASASYNDVKVTFSKVRFIESEMVPRDSEIIDHQWEHIRVDGGPDRRYSDNKKLPIVHYGLIGVTLGKNYGYQFYVSNLAYGQEVVEALTKYIEIHKTPKSL